MSGWGHQEMSVSWPVLPLVSWVLAPSLCIWPMLMDFLGVLSLASPGPALSRASLLSLDRKLKSRICFFSLIFSFNIFLTCCVACSSLRALWRPRGRWLLVTSAPATSDVITNTERRRLQRGYMAYKSLGLYFARKYKFLFPNLYWIEKLSTEMFY